MKLKPVNLKTLATTISAVSLLAGCGDDDINPGNLELPASYEFESLTDTSSGTSVEHAEATTRLVLIKELEYLIGSDYLQAVGQNLGPEAAEALLYRIYEGGTKALTDNVSTSNLYDVYDPNDLESQGSTPIKGMEFDIPLKQTTFQDLHQGINLKEVMPGISYELHYKESLSDELIEQGAVAGPQFIGLATGIVADENNRPNVLIEKWFTAIARLAADEDDTTRYLETNFNYKSLVTEFLLQSIAGPQVTNHHLATSALSMDNQNADPEHPNYTPLQHQWDLAWGYYGANIATIGSIDARTVNFMDLNSDNLLDVFKEVNFDFMLHSSDRDDKSPFSTSTFADTFLTHYASGRVLIDMEYLGEVFHNDWSISNNAESLNRAWVELASATAIHYANSMLLELLYFTSEDEKYNADKYVDAWAKLKATTMALQFYPNNKLDKTEFSELQQLVGNKVIFEDTPTKMNNYIVDLFEVLEILATPYEFNKTDYENW